MASLRKGKAGKAKSVFAEQSVVFFLLWNSHMQSWRPEVLSLALATWVQVVLCTSVCSLQSSHLIYLPFNFVYILCTSYMLLCVLVCVGVERRDQ